MYKVTKGNLSMILKSKADIDLAIKDGFMLDGEVNEQYEVINAKPFEQKVPTKKAKK